MKRNYKRHSVSFKDIEKAVRKTLLKYVGKHHGYNPPKWLIQTPMMNENFLKMIGPIEYHGVKRNFLVKESIEEINDSNKI